MIRRLIAVVVLLYLLGFAAFMLMLPRPLEEHPTDAVVVLTGAAGRIDRGLDLIAKHQAKRMLISGVAPGVRPIDLSIQYHVPMSLFTCCIDLGREAVDTHSNAVETARWLSARNYKSVRLVTSDWHMARARMELGAALGSDVTLVSDAVPDEAPLGLLIVEYNKLLLRRVAIWTGIGE